METLPGSEGVEGRGVYDRHLGFGELSTFDEFVDEGVQAGFLLGCNQLCARCSQDDSVREPNLEDGKQQDDRDDVVPP